MTDEKQDWPESEFIDGDPSVELSSNRTAMSFQRTGMSSDRTLMAIIRTSLSLISFGFTIYQAFRSLFRQLSENGTVIGGQGPRNFGLALISLGILLLVLGLFNHWKTTQSLRVRRQRLFQLGIIRHTAPIEVSTVTVVAILLLFIGVLAIASIAFQAGPL